jgi:hypothetical protein
MRRDRNRLTLQFSLLVQVKRRSECSSPQGGESGFDAGKKVKGRKRNLVVDTMGLVISLTVTAASVQDRDAAAAAAVVAQACAKAPGLQKLYTDSAYGGACARNIEQRHYLRVEVVRRPGNGTTGTLHNFAQGTGPAAEINTGSWPYQSGGSLSGRTRGLNAGAVPSCITTENWLFRPLGFGWPRPGCYSTD